MAINLGGEVSLVKVLTLGEYTLTVDCYVGVNLKGKRSDVTKWRLTKPFYFTFLEEPTIKGHCNDKNKIYCILPYW